MAPLLRSLRDPWRTTEGRLLYGRDHGDGVLEQANLDGARLKAPEGRYYYFRVFNPGRWNREGKVYMTVRYRGAGFELCHYSSSDPRMPPLQKVYHPAEEHYRQVVSQNGGAEKADVFLLADPAFGHLMWYKGDIRCKREEDTILTGFNLRCDFRDRQDFRLKPEIVSFLLELTNTCNFRCPYCPSSTLQRKRGVMPVRKALEIVDQLAALGQQHLINLHVLGEPMLHPHFWEILNYCSKVNVPVVLFTNGSLLDRSNAEMLLDAAPQLVIISCHTDNPAVWGIRGAQMGISEYEARIRDLLEAKIRRRSLTLIRLQYLDSRYSRQYRLVHSDDQARAIVRKWRAVLAEIEAAQSRESSRATAESVAECPAPELDALGCCEVVPGVEVIFVPLHSWGHHHEEEIIQKKRGFCHVPFDALAVSWNGDTTVCCLDSEGQINIGNAFDQPIEEIWLGQRRRRVLDRFLKRDIPFLLCQRCLSTLPAENSRAWPLLPLQPLRRCYGFLRKYYRFFTEWNGGE